RAISEAWRVAGTAGDATGTADNPAPLIAASSTALVSSSTKSGTPSVRSMISSTISVENVGALPIMPRMSSSLSSRPKRRRDNVVVFGWSVQGGWYSGRKVAISSTGRRSIRSTVRSSSSRGGRVGPMQILDNHQHGLAAGQTLELSQQGCERLFLLALRRQI